MGAKSKSSKTKQGQDCLTQSPTSWVQLDLPLFSTAESHQQNKETTSIDLLSSCQASTQELKSSKTSVADSTLKEKVLEPYWTESCQEISSKLLLPVGTDSRDLDSSLYSVWSNKTVEKSWFSTTLYTAQNQKPTLLAPGPGGDGGGSLSSIFSPVESTDLESAFQKSKKIRIYLNREQRQLLRQWIGFARFTYNRTALISSAT